MAGKIVKLKSNGKTGMTKNGDPPVNGKIKVYLKDDTKVLVRPSELIHLGFYD